VLKLWNNFLTGPCHRRSASKPLQWLDVSRNMSVQVPAGLCDSRTKLIVFNNVVTGWIPAGLSAYSSLVRVRA
jgi:hypothetical protein